MKENRFNRIMTLLSVFGLFGLLWNHLKKLLISSYSNFSIDGVPINPMQMIATSVTSGYILLCMIGILFVFFEMNSFRNVIKEKYHYTYSALAEISYNLLFTSAIYIFCITIFLTMFVDLYPSILNIATFFYKNIIWFILLFVLVALLFIFKRTRKKISLFLKKRSKRSKEVERMYLENDNSKVHESLTNLGLNTRFTSFMFIVYALFFWLIALFPLFLIIGINNNVHTEVSMEFDKKDDISIEFSSRTSDYLPKEIIIINCNQTNNCKDKNVINIDKFLVSTLTFTTKDGSQTSRNIPKTNIKQSLEMKLSELGIKKGDIGNLIIEFKYEKLSTVTNFQLSNSYNYDNKNIDFHIKNHKSKL